MEETYSRGAGRAGRNGRGMGGKMERSRSGWEGTQGGKEWVGRRREASFTVELIVVLGRDDDEDVAWVG